MGRKSSPKTRGVTSSPSGTKRSNLPVFALVAVVVIATGVFVLVRGRDMSNATTPAPTQGETAAADKAAPTEVPPAPDPAAETAAKAAAAFGPHRQDRLPPIPFQGYAPPRPPEVVAAAFQFAAEHPEILSYIPCFCGCQMMGHTGNENCFVRSRAANGDVTEWEPHGVDCAVCIDVATRSRQMYSSGASVRDIRAAIEKEYAQASTRTPTPRPPSH